MAVSRSHDGFTGLLAARGRRCGPACRLSGRGVEARALVPAQSRDSAAEPWRPSSNGAGDVMKKGIALALASAVLFSTLYYYSTLLNPLDGGEIFAWRVVLAVPALALLISQMRGWNEARRLWASLRSEEHTSELQSLMRISYA